MRLCGGTGWWQALTRAGSKINMAGEDMLACMGLELEECKRLFKILKASGALDDDDEVSSWCGVSVGGGEQKKGGWTTSIYLREPLLPASVAGMCLGGETPAALALYKSMVDCDPTLVYFMRDALKHGSCAVCHCNSMFEVDSSCRVFVSVARQMCKMTCDPECYEKLAENIEPCLVFWYKEPEWSTQTTTTQKTKQSSPSTSSTSSASPSSIARPATTTT